MVDYGHLPSTSIILPKLRVLEVEGTDRDPRLFNVIDVRSSTRVAASFIDDGVKSDTTTDVLSALGTLFTRLTATSNAHIVQTMVINILRPQSQQLILSSDGDPLPFLDLDLDWMYIGRHEYSKTWRSKLPIAKIPELTINDKFTPRGESSVWSGIIPLFQNLKGITFKRFRPHTLLAILADITAASTHNGPSNTNLAVVSFVDVAWAQLEEELYTFFKHRCEIGMPVHTLRIRRCVITQKQVDDFALFADVDWDGVTSLGDQGVNTPTHERPGDEGTE
ncbi:hypothetical protein ONZ45_g4406 [Pleurotus djamor]|nr:hypothetical protein ONZ45_g4406 [Pleurotus djamor]